MSWYVWQFKFQRRCRLFLAAALSLCVLSSAAHATVLDWPTGGWTAGAPAPGQTATQSFTAVTPNDVTVSINNNGSATTGSNWVAGYPTIDSTTVTGGFTGTNGLQLAIANSSSTSDFVRTTVSFAAPVVNLTFQIWDVDLTSGTFTDVISNIMGMNGATVVAATSVTNEVPGYNTVTGSGLGVVVTGTNPASNSTNQGTIDITFTNTQFAFDWSNDDPALGQHPIALSPLTFDIVPEMSAGVFVSLVCLLALVSSEISRRAKSTTTR